MRALVNLLVVSLVVVGACASPGSKALSTSLVDDVLVAEGQAVETFTTQVERQVEIAGGPVVGGSTSVANGKDGPKVNVGGIQVGNGKVVVPGVTTVGNGKVVVPGVTTLGGP